MRGHVNCQPEMLPKQMKNVATKRTASAFSYPTASKLAQPSIHHKQFNVGDYVCVSECLDQLDDRFNLVMWLW